MRVRAAEPTDYATSCAYAKSSTSPIVVICPSDFESRPVGYIHFSIVTAPHTPIHVPRKVLHIETLVVAHDAAIECARTEGATDVGLVVYRFNDDAIHFYEKLGYEVEALRLRRPI